MTEENKSSLATYEVRTGWGLVLMSWPDSELELALSYARQRAKGGARINLVKVLRVEEKIDLSG